MHKKIVNLAWLSVGQNGRFFIRALLISLLLIMPSFATGLQAQAQSNSRCPPHLASINNIPDTYIVRSGDNLSTIVSCIFGNLDFDKMQEIAALNNLSNINAIRVGQELQLPSDSREEPPENPNTAIQVTTATNTQPIPDALVYYLPAGQTNGGRVLGGVDEAKTNSQGVLQTSETFADGAQLLALAPIAQNSAFRLFYMSGRPTETGIETAVWQNDTPPNLAISAENPLLLFDFEISLEWNANASYRRQLARDIERASEILFDLSNGQAALGNVTIYQNKEMWHQADIIVFADNTFRPNANLGGIVNTTFTHTFPNNEQMTIDPGQIRMAATWNRFGEPNRRVGEDWARTLAHEIAHYAFFIPDNYIGIENGLPIDTDCQGSVLTDAYREDYSEWLTPQQWRGDCEKTIAAHTSELSDWETVQQFYPFLNYNADLVSEGPNELPFAFTNIIFPSDAKNDLRFYYMREQSTRRRLFLSSGEADIYLFKTNETATPTDDDIIRIGTSNNTFFSALGAATGDRLCVYNTRRTPIRLGCEVIRRNDSTLHLDEAPGWQPDIKIKSNVELSQLEVEVAGLDENVVEGTLQVQLFPGVRPEESVKAPVAEFVLENGRYTATIPVPTAKQLIYGYVRVWDTATGYETIELFANFGISTETVNSTSSSDTTPQATIDLPDWTASLTTTKDLSTANIWSGFGPNAGGDFGNANVFLAPLNSPDSQVIVFNTDNPLDGIGQATLQTISTPPELPAWLTSVGDIYRFSKDEFPDQLAIQMQYSERGLPTNDESLLRLYHQSPDQTDWQPLETNINPTRNVISARMPGEGLYALMVTIPPSILYGWIEATPNFTPAAQMEIQASFRGNLCGSGNIDSNLNPDNNTETTEYAFVITINPSACSLIPGQELTITVGGVPMKRTNGSSITWINQEAQLMTLTQR